MYNVPPVHFYGMNPYAMTAHPQQMAMYHASMMHVMPAAPLPPPSAPIAQQSPNDPFHNTRSTRLSRWSVDQSMHPPAPTYIPQELLTMLGGKVLRALLLRALSDDMVRLRDSHQIELFFLKRKPRVEPAQFDAQGRRINLTEKNFTEKHRTLGKELLEMSSELNRQSVIRKEITHKLYFTAQQVANRAYGAIIGGRGRTHQEIEKETRCRLILGGKGISNPNSSARSGRCGSESMVDNDDRAHVKIIAPSEAALQKAVEKIEFIMSDSIDAQIFREENRKKLAIMNGTYREDTWVSHAPVRPPKRSAEEEAQENLSKKPLTEEEKKYDSILKDVLNGT